MSDDVVPANDAMAPLGPIAEVSRLANLLAERVLSEHMADRPVPDTHIQALAQAAQLLDEYGQEVPPPLGPIMDQLRADAGSDVEANRA